MNKVIFILGSGHCGSTLLDLILGSHSKSFSLGEIQRINTAIDKSQDGPVKICGVCSENCDFWNERASGLWLQLLYSRKNKFRSLIRRVINHFVNHYEFLMRWSECSILIDSSKNEAWIDRQLTPSFKWRSSKPYLIYLSRDGRAVTAAYYRKYPERGFEQIVLNWKQQIQRMEQYYDSYPAEQKIKISYEALSTEPERVIRAICKQFSIEYEAEMLQYWAHDHHHVFGNGGTRSLIYRYREQFTPHTTQLKERISNAKQHYKHEYYDMIDVAIRLDQRWREELSEKQLATFDCVAGKINKLYAYGDH